MSKVKTWAEMLRVVLANRLRTEDRVGHRRVATPPAVTWTAAISTLTCLLLIGMSTARAQTHIAAPWGSHTNGGNWAAASNWNCTASGQGPFSCVPADGGGNLYNVGIATTSSATITFDANPTTIDTLLVGGLATLQDDGNSRFLTIGDPNSNFSSSGTLTVSGTINWGDGGILTIGTMSGSNAKITNVGTINISDAQLLVNGNFGTNSGTLTIAKASEGNVTGKFTSTGVINITGDSNLLVGTLNTSGSLTVQAGSLLQPSLFEMSGGTADIAGTLKTSTFVQTGGTVTVESGATVSAEAWDIYGGTATVQGQVITETPPSGTINIRGTLQEQGGSSVGINGNLTVSGSVITGTGSNSLNIQNTLTVNNGTVSVSPSGTVTAGSITSSGGTLILAGSSLVTDTGNLTNSGHLVVSGCPLGACNSNALAQITIGGTLTNTGTVDLNCEFNTVACGFITLETVQGDINSGNIGMGIIDSLMLFGQGLAGSDGGELGNLVDPPNGSPGSTTGANFNNLKRGSVELTAAGVFLMGTGSFNNNAGSTLTINGGNDRLIAASVVNGGKVSLAGKGDAIVTPSFINTGTVSIGAGEAVAIKTLNLGTSVGIVNATSYLQTAGSTDVNGTLFSPLVSISGGTLSGNGLIASLPSTLGGSPNPTVVTFTGGKVIPGEPSHPGTLTINGSYTQGAGVALVIDVNGPGSGQFSVLDVLGAASLNGDVTFDFGFKPLAGDTFTFLTADAGDLSGTFFSDTFNGSACSHCTLVYNDSNGTVTLDVGSTATPEPSSFLLLGTGLLGLSYGMRRRLLK